MVMLKNYREHFLFCTGLHWGVIEALEEFAKETSIAADSAAEIDRACYAMQAANSTG